MEKVQTLQEEELTGVQEFCEKKANKHMPFPPERRCLGDIESITAEQSAQFDEIWPEKPLL